MKYYGDFQKEARAIFEQRAKDYASGETENSMGKVVRAFNAITGHALAEEDGWLFMQVLKDVRQWAKPDRYHEDSAVDAINYCLLKAVALQKREMTCLHS